MHKRNKTGAFRSMDEAQYYLLKEVLEDMFGIDHAKIDQFKDIRDINYYRDLELNELQIADMEIIVSNRSNRCIENVFSLHETVGDTLNFFAAEYRIWVVPVFIIFRSKKNDRKDKEYRHYKFERTG